MKYSTQTVFVLSYETANKAGCVMVRAYSEKERAAQDYELVKDVDATKTWKVQEVPIIAPTEPNKRRFAPPVGTRQ